MPILPIIVYKNAENPDASQAVGAFFMFGFCVFFFDFAVFYVPVFFVSSPNIRDKRRASALGERTNTIFISYSLRMRYAVEFWKPLGLPTHILFKTAGSVT